MSQVLKFFLKCIEANNRSASLSVVIKTGKPRMKTKKEKQEAINDVAVLRGFPFSFFFSGS